MGLRLHIEEGKEEKRIRRPFRPRVAALRFRRAEAR
jgi:hypothetical protein